MSVDLPVRDKASNYHYGSGRPAHTHSYLWPLVQSLLEGELGTPEQRRVFDLGCGNGAFASHLSQRGFEVVGVDPSEQGIEIAQRTHPELQLSLGSAYDGLAQEHRQFSCLVSLEVIEHVYEPRRVAESMFDLVEPNGLAILSTPYHGYWKNLALALTGKMDNHFTSLWDNGHIKFWSIRTLSQLLREAGFRELAFHRVGRIPQLAKSMVVVARKPAKP